MSSDINRVVRHLRQALEGEGMAGLRDEQLLERFAGHHDEDAFTALVQRHGPLVLGVCRRVLHNVHDAEDAFQAAFLVLARRAGSIRKAGSMAAWMHAVAVRVARQLHADTLRRRHHEHNLPPPEIRPPNPAAAELHAILDEELRRLPDRCRQAVLLCDLEGLTQDEAAAQLLVPRGTLKRRLEKGRALLRDRLTRRGLALAGGLVAAVAGAEASAAVHPPLIAHLPRAAALFAARQPVPLECASTQIVALAEGVLTAMFTAKLRIAAALLVLVIVTLSGAVVFAQHFATNEGAPPQPTGVAVQPAQPRPQPQPTRDKPAPGGEDKKPAEPVKISAAAPDTPPKLAAVNGGEFTIAFDFENTSKQDIVLWPYLSVTVKDDNGKEVQRSRKIGRFGLRSDTESILEGIKFVTLKPGEKHQIEVNLANCFCAAEMIQAWRLPAAGKYTVELRYHYDRADVKKRFGEGKTKDFDGANQPWNRAVEIDRTVTVKLTVAE
jgi:RNA polymerase sigma-70 factor (ECF subfamily)